MNKKTNIIIYKNKIELKLESETLWLTQKQIADLFDKDIRTINEHIINIYKEEELSKTPTIRKNRIVQIEGKRSVTREVEFFNLDVIISVGYRVNSKKGTHFRIWATNILKKHLTEGYTINEKRLNEAKNKYFELSKTLELLSENINKSEDVSDEAKGILKVLNKYSKSLDILDGYDHQTLKIPKGNKKEKYKITYKKALEIVAAVKDDFKSSKLVGQERDQGLESIINDLYQTFGGKDVYPTVQEKAANLLYLITKNHCFTDGNKRIAAAIFISYIEKNRLLLNKKGIVTIDGNTLVALTLMIATSNPKEKDIMIKIIANLLNA